MPVYILPLLLLLLTASQEGDSLQTDARPDTTGVQGTAAARFGPLFHLPPEVGILNDRPFTVDLFVDLDPDSITSVSLLYRTDSAQVFREIPLKGEYGRYRVKLPEEELSGETLIYYFVVTFVDYRLWAYPRGADGRIRPFVGDLVPPSREYFRRLRYD